MEGAAGEAAGMVQAQPEEDRNARLVQYVILRQDLQKVRAEDSEKISL
jgi:hypothetical protein